MRKHLFGIALLVLAIASVAVAADDPFTGTWRPIAQDRELRQLIFKPADDGITIDQTGGEPFTLKWGKDTFMESQKIFANIVRVDEYTLKTTYSYSQGGGIVRNETGTVSTDGKHYTLLAKFPSAGRELRLEYDRIGSVPATGDSFWGTWKQVRQDTPPFLILTLKVDGDNFELARGGPLKAGVTAKFDGKEYKANRGDITYLLKRVDGHTIEMERKVPPREIPKDSAARISPEMAALLRKGSESKEIWQVKGDILTITSQDLDGSQGETTVQEFERVK